MHVLVLGATGYLGSVATEHLLAAGHRVTALVRPTSASALPRGVAVHRGDLGAPAALRAAVTDDVDAVLHLATPGDDPETDRAAVDALLEPVRGTGRAFVYGSGVWVLGAAGDRPATEEDPVAPIRLVGHRPAIEQLVRQAAATGVRSTVVRPGVVHGRAAGIPAMLVDWAAAAGGGRHVGPAATRWPMVHVDDLADLFVLAVERSPSGAVLHGVTEPGVPVGGLAAAAATAAGVDGQVEAWPHERAVEMLGAPFAEALALDQVVSGERARADLGWRPHHVEALTDLAHGSYRRRTRDAA